MRILVFGAGAIGSAFGGFLSRSLHQIVLYGRPWHLNRIKRNGLQVKGIWGRHKFKNFRICTRLAELKRYGGSFDLALLTVKSFDTRRACLDLKRVISSRTIIVSLQNGLGNIETLHEHFPKRQVLAARVIFGVELSPGAIQITVWGGDVLIGETLKKQITKRVKLLAHLFSSVGIRSKPVLDIDRHIWAKVIYNSALNPLASLLGVHYGVLLEHELTRRLMVQVVYECYQVARQAGIQLVPRTPKAYLRLLFRKLIPDTYDHHPSMLYDLRRKRKTEIDSMNGAICALARKLNVPTPVNRLLADMVKTGKALY